MQKIITPDKKIKRFFSFTHTVIMSISFSMQHLYLRYYSEYFNTYSFFMVPTRILHQILSNEKTSLC